MSGTNGPRTETTTKAQTAQWKPPARTIGRRGRRIAPAGSGATVVIAIAAPLAQPLAEDAVPSGGELRPRVDELRHRPDEVDVLLADRFVDGVERVLAATGRLEALHESGEAGLAHRLLPLLRVDEVQEQLRGRGAGRLLRDCDAAGNERLSILDVAPVEDLAEVRVGLDVEPDRRRAEDRDLRSSLRHQRALARDAGLRLQSLADLLQRRPTLELNVAVQRRVAKRVIDGVARHAVVLARVVCDRGHRVRPRAPEQELVPEDHRRVRRHHVDALERP